MEGKAKVGVYVCHCGLNIAGVVNCEEVAEFASKLPDVTVARDERYMCADPGQELIKRDIKELGLNRVVVAACSPRMHEPTFRTCVSDAGLNPYLFEMANIREHCTWCHPHDPEASLQKAKDLVETAVAKARNLQPLEVLEVPVTQRALVIGGGVAGIHAALDLGDMGYEVYLVEREPTIGGWMALLDKTFPTLDCSICILGPKMVEVARHPNIKLLTYSEVREVEGYVGNFRVKILRKPRYVDIEKCNACGECVKVCPVEVPDKYNLGLGWRKAIYIPYPQAVPASYVLDVENCLGLVPLACTKCKEACDESGAGAINFDASPENLELEVGVIIVATGYSPYDPSEVKEYGYGVYPNVLTCIELERLINAAGPTGGNVIRPSDGRNPKRVAFIQCVGSRDERRNIYCSGFCCMYTIKNAILLKEHHPDVDIHIFYMDIRAAHKGYEEFYQRAREEGITFIRGRPAEIAEDPQTKNLIVYSENLLTGRPMELEVDMVVLSTAAVPNPGTEDLMRTLNIATDPSGFFMESHPKLKPIDAATDGVFLCGSAQGPKDIPYSVSQGSAVASRSARILSRDRWEIEPIVAYVDAERCLNVKAKCEICVTRCPYGAISVEPGQPSRVSPAKCHGCGTCVADCPGNAITQMHFTDTQIISQIHAVLRENPEEKIVGFLCNWCSYAGADLAGTSRLEYPANVRAIRVMCSGRVDKDFVLEAFRRGAGMVLVSGCRLTELGSDCHYISGNVHAERRIKTLSKLIERMGISPQRLRLEWISASEGDKYASVVREMTEQLRAMGVDRIREENEKARPQLDRMLKHLPKIEMEQPVAGG
ncbi:MAG: CoB-CoM heterodisulfide reductase HdrA2 [Candidatus Geothermarchaeales archaeon]